MNIITQEWIKKYNQKKYELINMKYEMIERVKEILIWENQNIGKKHDIDTYGVTYNYDFDMDTEGIYLKVYSSWAYGGHDEEEIFISYNKLLNDDWRENAVKEYKNNLEAKQKYIAKQIEITEQAELKRLKEKYEKHGE